jgi:aminoglycoside 3-N-acetyltransferase
MYKFKDLVNSYRDIGITKGSIISLKTDLLLLGGYEKNKKREILTDHLNAIDKVINLDKGTVVVQSASTSLCNTETPYNYIDTPSETGVLTEFIRGKTESIRSYHAFESYAALGRHSDEICNNVTRHSYGVDTPEYRMIEMGAKCVSLGIKPRKSCSTVHHVEAMVGVPYRYVKEYNHPVEHNGIVKKERFYRYVWYQNCGIKRNYNKKLFRQMLQNGFYTSKVKIGSGYIYAYNMKEFYKYASDCFKEDMYIWLDKIPDKKPWLE